MADRAASEHVILVYCTCCNKTHAVKRHETPCAKGAWLDPTPLPQFARAS